MDTLETTVLGHVALGGYIDSYFGYQWNRPASNDVQYFVTNHRNNELAINLAYVDVRYRSSKMRARFVPGFGTYMNANYLREPQTLRNLVEANVGILLSEKKKIWLDAGVFGSPYTNESAISKDHLMYTRSLAPENVPYYLTGIKVGIPLSDKVNLTVYALNGWQVIADNNQGKSFGTQLEIRPGKNLLLNWNTYVGDERRSPSPDFRMRYFSDFFFIGRVNEKFDYTTCMYAGIQQRSGLSNAAWWQANFIGRYHFNSIISLSGRIEYFNDPQEVFHTNLAGDSKFNLGSAGLCLNVKATERSLFRIDGRQFFSPVNMFSGTQGNTSHNLWLVGSLTAWF